MTIFLFIYLFKNIVSFNLFIYLLYIYLNFVVAYEVCLLIHDTFDCVYSMPRGERVRISTLHFFTF